MIPALLFAACMGVYLSTIAPTLSFFDSGEMIAGCYTLGVAHPPGYPVYVTLGKIFTFLPLGNIAFRVNLMSSFFATMTSVLIYYITRAVLTDQEEKRPEDKKKQPGAEAPGDSASRFRPGAADLAGIFAALAFALSYNLWAWAVVSKFYTLNAFVVACITMLLIRWRRARKEEGNTGGGHSVSFLYVIAFLFGIAAVVHISQFVLIPVYLLYILIVDGSAVLGVPAIRKMAREPASYIILGLFILLEVGLYYYPQSPNKAFMAGAFALLAAYLFVRGAIQFKTVALMAFFFLLGHSIYLHLPLRAAQEPLINWGAAVDWPHFRWVYNREGYPVVGGIRTWDLFWKQAKSFNLVREFTWAGIPLILAGLVAHYRIDKRNFVFLVFGSAFMTSVIVVMGNPIEENIFLLEQFYIPVYIFLCVIMGGAIYYIIKKRPSAPWIMGLTLPFIFVGEVPWDYLFGGGQAVRKVTILGFRFQPALYFVFYAVLAGLVVFCFMKLLKIKSPASRWLYAAMLAVLFLLYPASQIKAHYWKNDRSNNFIAYDMGSAELNFAPQFAVLFTWGDSGAFPMWYLQDVERKRPDVLLVHTPHLPLDWFLESIRRTPGVVGDPSEIRDNYGKLRNYNGLKGIEQLLSIPEDFREPAAMIKDLAEFNRERPITFDYSSRYSVTMPFNVFPYGIIYRELNGRYAEENLMTWRYLVTRGLPDPTESLDLDESKAVSIYGFVHADIGKKYIEMGLKPLADQEFTQAVRYAPELWDSLELYINEKDQ